jgi:hypothetical protein
MNQEIKFLYRKKQKLNELLYKIHLKCAKYWNVTWQHTQISIDAQLDIMMDSIYCNLNKKLHALQKHEQHNNNNTTKYSFHKRLVNLTNIKFNTELINTLNLGFEYATEKKPKTIY